MDIIELIENRTNLSEHEKDKILSLNDNLEYIADIADSDVFIDTYDKTGKVIVLTEAHPRWTASAYNGSVVGCEASKENEPAVYHALELGAPVRDIKAETQEGKTVKQDVIPIINDKGSTFAVLIREKDITESVSRDKKYSKLLKEHEKIETADIPVTVVREVNHRIKNNLQVIASIMRLQAKTAENESARIFLEKNIQRVLIISTINDILCISDNVEVLEIKGLLQRIASGIGDIFSGYRDINISVIGDNVEISADKATAVASVVNELIFNAMEHAFENNSGNVVISIQKGNQNLTVAVEDDGKGFNVSDVDKRSMGLKIVTQTVKEKLNSEIRIISDNNGTKASFDFKIN